MIEVLRGGLLTTVQDLGRPGYRDQGVPPSGALDAVSLRLANLLVGNPEDAAGLEITLAGPRLHFGVDAVLALVGGDADARIGDEPVPGSRAFRVHAGETLEIGAVRRGCRAYLACAGGIATPPVLASRSTALLGDFGGLDGRALRQGDRLPTGAPGLASGRLLGALARRRAAAWSLAPEVAPGPAGVIRALPGMHLPALTPVAWRALWSATFRIGRDSDRMGCRLEGPPLEVATPLELTSEGVAPGTVQLPPGGVPIVLLADGGTTGGYPRIAHVAAVDLPVLAQLRPGDSFRLAEVALDEAHWLLLRRERGIARVAESIRLRMAAA